MRTRAAVLVADGRDRPYATSTPIELHDLDLDPPGPGELLVRVDAAGLCHSDLSVVDGNRPRPTPMVLGHEAAGTVIGIGSGVTDVAPGEKVVLVFVPRCGACRWCARGRPALCAPAAAANTAGELLGGGRRWGRLDGEVVHHHLGVSAFAEHVVVDRGSAVVVPDDLPATTAALFGCALLTGVGAVLHTAHVRPGDGVVVFGLGGVGLAAVLGATLAGAEPIIAVDPVAAKRDLAVSLGATHALPAEGAVEAVRELTRGGADHAFEAVGAVPVLTAAWQATGRGGTTVAIGLPHPKATLSLPAVRVVGEARRLVGSYLGDAVPQDDLPRLIALWRSGRLPVERLHTSTRPLTELNAALDQLADGDGVRQVLQPHD